MAPAVTIIPGPDGPMLQVEIAGRLQADEARALARALDAKAEEIDPTPNGDKYRAAAMEDSREGELEVDDNAMVSKGDDDGAYVQAWMWVSDEDAGIEHEEA